MTEFVLDALATHRLVRLIVQDEITAALRTSLIGWSLKNGYTKFRYLLTCPFCVGPYAAVVVLLLRRSRARDVLALAGASALLLDLLEPSLP